MSGPFLNPAERVRSFLASSGVEFEIRTFDSSTGTSLLAAGALGCSIAEIAKSVVLVAEGPAVVILSGDRRVDLSKAAQILGAMARVASPSEVEQLTGYRIGGVPPFPHSAGVRVVADDSLTRHETVWAAGGASNTVFRARTRDIVKLAGGSVGDLSS